MRDIERLVDGFQRFQQQYYEDAPSLYRSLREGQHPSTLLIGCCDSRVDPAMLLGCDPGDIFTVRNVANLVPPSNTDRGLQGVLAAIQFAVEQLQVNRIIVLGHAHCGGIRTLMDRGLRGAGNGTGDDAGNDAAKHAGNGGEPDYLERWMDIAEPARRRVLQQMPDASTAERRRACEQASILISMRNLEELPFVRRAVQSGSLTLHGWYFDLVAGALLAYSARADAFLPIVCPLFTELA
ncbi:carbonic anhydrase [Achromobacter denitrificans]